MDNAHISAYDQALRETFKVPETGAVLTYEGAVPLVEQTCSLLPHSMGVAPPKPIYEGTTTMSDGNPCYFISNLRLPTAVPLPKHELLFHGTPRTSKAEAKRAVAFEAAKTLWKYKLLNQHLLPHREKKGDQAEDGAGRTLGEDLDLEFEVDVLPTWGNIWAEGARLFIHPLVIKGKASLGIVAARKITVQEHPFFLWHGRDEEEHQVEISNLPGIPIAPPSGMSSSQILEALEKYSRTVMTRVIRPHYLLEGKMACLFAPLTEVGTLDMQLIKKLADSETHVKWTSPDAFEYLAFDSLGRQIQVERIRPALNPSSPPIYVEQLVGEPQCREFGFESYEAYARKKLLYMTGTASLLDDADPVMLQVVSLRRRRNNLISQQHAILAEGIHGRTKGHAQGQRFLIPRKLVRLSNVPLSLRDSLMVSAKVVVACSGYELKQRGCPVHSAFAVHLALHDRL